MTKKFLKLGTKLTIFCLSLLMISFFTLSLVKSAKAASGTFYYFNVSVGETFEEAGINYHSNIDGSSIYYSTSPSMDASIKAETTSILWGVDPDMDDENTGFSDRYVCRASLKGLLPNTTYYYQAVSGDEKSEIRQFKTGGKGGSSSILFLTDTQSSNTNYFSKINPVVEAIEKKEKNLNLLVMTGDIVDRGGYSAQWDSFFNGLTSVKNYQQATIPGNHEYYHTNRSEYVTALYYNQFYYNPQNGPADRLNSSYYFIYNDILFFMLDILPGTQSGYDLKAHQEWFKQVVQDNPTRWIIVGSHAGAVSAGAYKSDASIIYNNWHETWEECQVDLAISGHEHIYIRKDLAYQGEKNEELGVTYLVGPAAGMKDYAAQTTEGLDAVIRGNYRGQVIKTQGNKMTVTLYGLDEKNQAATYAQFTLNAKRNGEVTEISDKEILDSVTYEYNKDDSSLRIDWTPDAWGNVKKVYCTGDFKWEQVMASCSQTFASRTMRGILSTNNYKLTINFLMKDGRVISRDLSIILNKDLIPSSITINGEKSLNVGENTTLTVSILPEGADTQVTWESLTPEILSVDETGKVTAISAGRGKIKATSIANPSVTRQFTINVKATAKPTKITVEGIPEVIEINKTYKFTVLAEPSEASKDVVWTTSDNGVAQVANGQVYAMGYGVATLTATSKVDETIKYTITVRCLSPLTSVSITNKVTEMNINDEITLGYTCNENANDSSLVWEVSDASIVSIENGKVKALKAGTVTITLKSKDNAEISDSVTITVLAPKEENVKKGCGCKKNIGLAFTLISLSTALVFVIRKKH